MAEFTRFGRRPTGDIRNFPRKDALENALLNFSTDKFEAEQILSVKYGLRNVDLEKIYVFGSWGRGRAIPFGSDLDLIFVLDRITQEIKEAKVIDSPMDLKTNFILFNGVQIFTASSNVELDLIQAVDNLFLELEMLTYEEPHIAYNLTDRQDIFLENEELQGLGL